MWAVSMRPRSCAVSMTAWYTSGVILLARAEVVVDPDLDEVDVHVGRRVHPLGGLFRGVGDDDRAGDADAGVVQIRTLAVAHGDGLGSVAAEADDRGDAVARVQRELVHHVLLGVEGRVGLGVR